MCAVKQHLLQRTFAVTPVRNFAMEVGDKASVTRVFTETDVRAFADVTWDTNPLHLEKEFTKTTRFRKPIVNGVLSLGLVICTNLFCDLVTYATRLAYCYAAMAGQAQAKGKAAGYSMNLDLPALQLLMHYHQTNLSLLGILCCQ